MARFSLSLSVLLLVGCGVLLTAAYPYSLKGVKKWKNNSKGYKGQPNDVTENEVVIDEVPGPGWKPDDGVSGTYGEQPLDYEFMETVGNSQSVDDEDTRELGSGLEYLVPETEFGTGVQPHIPKSDLGISHEVVTTNYIAPSLTTVPNPGWVDQSSWDGSSYNGHRHQDGVHDSKDYGSKDLNGGYVTPDHDSKEEKHTYKGIKTFFKDFSAWLGNKTGRAIDTAGKTFATAYETVAGGFSKLSNKFKLVLSRFGVMVHRGAACVFQKITVTYDEARSSELLAKMEKLLENGDETVTEFFQKVGEKVTKWMEQNHPANIDEGLFQKTDYSQHFSDPSFSSIFEEPEIQKQLERMSHQGIFTQEEISQISHTQDVGVREEIPYNPYEGAGFGVPPSPEVPKHDPHHTTKKELEEPVPEVPDYGSKKGSPGYAIHFPTKW